MKKLMALLLAFVMMLALVACGDSSSLSGDKESNKKEAITFTEQIVMDNEYCKITITDIDPDNMWGYTLKACLENKSADTAYTFTVDDAAINGVMSDPIFTVDVEPGKKANEEISFSGDDTLEEMGVGNFTDIELLWRVHEVDNWEEDAVKEIVHVYPYGEDKATKFERKNEDSDNVLVDNDDMTVIVTGYEEDELWGYSVNLFFVNKTDKELMFSWDDVSVNGYMMDPYFATSVWGGKCGYSSVSWSESDWEENDISDVEEIEFTLDVRDYNDWMADYLLEKKFTLNP